MTINTGLLRQALEHITAHPTEWEQGTWGEQEACGTVMCLAGHVASLAKADMYWEEGQLLSINGTSPAIGSKQLLGLTYDQADELFAEENSLGQMWAMAEVWTHGEIRCPATVPGPYRRGCNHDVEVTCNPDWYGCHGSVPPFWTPQ